MNSHELAKKLLSLPDRNVILSIDLSTDDDTAGNRSFSEDVILVQDNGESAKSISILAESGLLNYDLKKTAPKSSQSESATPSSKWFANGEQDPHENHYDCERSALLMGDLTDDELANAVFLYGNITPNIQDVIDRKAFMPIAYLTAAKERIRWLSRRLNEASRKSLPNLIGYINPEFIKQENWFSVHVWREKGDNGISMPLYAEPPAMTARETRLECALKKIAKWHGEFPDTEKFFDEEKTRSMSYGACYGSNGERDFMRKIAQDALNGIKEQE